MARTPSYLYRTILLLTLIASPPAAADLPLAVEDLLTTEGRWRLELGTTYSSRDTTDATGGDPILVQIGPTQFVNLPTTFGETRRNTDTLVLSPGLRYGLAADTELYTRVSALHSDTRTLDPNGNTGRDRETRVSDAWLGINYRFLREERRPALLGFVEGAVAENDGDANQEAWAYGKTWLLGFTTYQTLDPIVLSLTAAYRLALERTVDGTRRDPGDLILLNPSIAFAANNEITLTGGLQWRWQQPNEVDGADRGIRTTELRPTLGAGLSLTRKWTLHLTFRSAPSADQASELSVTTLYSLN